MSLAPDNAAHTMTSSSVSVSAYAVSRVVTLACLTISGAAAAMEISDFGSFTILGEPVSLRGQAIEEIATSANMKPYVYDPNGDFETGQMYVSYIKPEAGKSRLPILMWHGGGMTGQTWETKPDGKPGWMSYFVNAGHDVYVSDAVERGKSSWSKYPEIYKTAPVFRTKREAWELFRIGPDYRNGENPVHYADTQFPLEFFRQFAAQSTPRWLSNDNATIGAYDQLVQRVCPCVIMAHSQGTTFALKALEHAPDKVKAVVLVEPSSAPNPEQVDFSAIKTTPVLFVWGDHIKEDPLWPGFQQRSQRYFDAMKRAGVAGTWMDLPAMGIKGNTHMIMMDQNSDQIAGLVQAWLAQQGLAAGPGARSSNH